MSECPREFDVVHAALTASWTPELQEHCAECPTCAEAVNVSRFLASATEPQAPPPGLVWFRAQRRLRQEALDRAFRPLRWAEGAVMGFGAAAGLGALAWTAQAYPAIALTAGAGLVVLASLAAVTVFQRPSRKTPTGGA